MTGHELDDNVKAALQLGALMDAVNAGRTRLSKAQRREIEAMKQVRRLHSMAVHGIGNEVRRDRDDFLAEMAKLGLGKGARR